MATREEQDGKENDQDEGDEPEHLYPLWSAFNGGTVGLESSVVAGVGIEIGVTHVQVLSVGAGKRVYETCCLLSIQTVLILTYASLVPKLWNESIEAHRRAVRDATLDVTAELVAGHGLRSVTMSQIAEVTGIGRATLYKYFSDVESILVAWHERQVAEHLESLVEVRDRAAAGDRLEAVLMAYALMSYEHHGTELAAVLHRREHVARAQQQLREFVRDLLAEGAETGQVRDDVAPEELASYCLHALAAASSLPSKAAVDRLVAVVLAGVASRG